MKSHQRSITEESYQEIITSPQFFSPTNHNYTDNAITPSNSNNTFLPFINERDSIGRLIGKHSTIKHKYKTILEKSIDKASTKKRSLLAKIFNDSVHNSQLQLEIDTFEDSMTKSANLMSPSRHSPFTDFKTIMSPSDKDSVVEDRKTLGNYEKFDNSGIIAIKKTKKKFQSQGSQLKLLSPRNNNHPPPPLGSYSVENSKKFIAKKEPICYISPKTKSERNLKLPKLNLKTLANKFMKSISETDMDYTKSRPKNPKNSVHNLPKEATIASIPFNFLNIEPQTSDLMRFNQIMTSKFEDTRSRLHGLKMKISGVALYGNKDRDLGQYIRKKFNQKHSL